MNLDASVANHYTSGRLMERILAALQTMGIEENAVTAEDLKTVDEFHIGGVAATQNLLHKLNVSQETRVLDIGSGIGGTARFIAGETGAMVTGVDLTPEFVDTARALSALVGLADRTRYEVGSATELPFNDETFDLALLLHVGMNIPDKEAVMAEAARVLKPGGIFAVYDVMKTGPDPIEFPVPWAETPDTSFLAPLEEYRAAAKHAGLRELSSEDRTPIALDFFAEQRARMEAQGAPVLGTHLLIGETGPQKLKNMVANITAGRVAPTELILQAP
ncbi:class I SAM-dependent methyltransferase [Acuticoccus kandeliae]|uniref:class I SAM-dependent methyltransferase n=1 Tax=Acuticoccus kandeliae TaxID=2073160 RepID=UPI000D3EB593|nr:class I SAM-dependent methyltransferase [Acuticoccus kandeliae]